MTDRPRVWRAAFLVAALLALTVGAYEARSLFAFYETQTRLPLWDMAGHGWGGVELLQALGDGQPLRFLNLLNRQDRWPFGFSLLLMPFLAAGDSTFASATVLSAVLFALAPALLLWAARETDPGPAGLWGGLLAAALFLASPLPRVLGVLVMRELAGIALSLLAFTLYLRARRLGTPWAWRLTGLVSLALFFVKYNYALIWWICVLVNEAVRLAPERRRELARQAGRILWPWPTRQIGRIALAVWLYALAAAALLEINFGIGLYAGLVIGAVILAVRYRRDREGMRAGWRSLPVDARAALATVVLPLWAWCLSPSPIHPKSIVSFLKNRATGPPLLSADSLLFYFRSLARDYSPEPLLGWALIGFLIASLVWLRRAREPWRVLALVALLGLALATLHPYKEPRFLASTAPFLMLLAALTASRLAHLARPVAGGLLCAGLLAGIVFSATQRAGLPARLAADYKLYSTGPAFNKPLGFLARWAGGTGRVAVLGTFNELSDPLVRWYLAQAPEARGAHVVDSLRRFDGQLPEEEIRERVGKWTREHEPERILAIRLQPSSPRFGGEDFQRYNAWQLAAIDALAKDPAWREARRRKFKTVDLEILVLDRKTPG